MRIVSRFGVVSAIFFLSFFSDALFSIADVLTFSIHTDTPSVILAPTTSTSTTVSIALNSLTSEPGENKYSLSLNTPCTNRDASTGNCFDSDPVPDLCKYIALRPLSGDSFDIAYHEGPTSEWFDEGFGHLFNPDKLQSNWEVSLRAPCFEGECPAGYNESLYGTPLPQTLKGKTFKCELLVVYQAPVFQVARSIAYASADTDRIVISAVIGTSHPVGCTENCYSNVAFIPGIEASRLYKQDYDPDCPLCEKRLWEPTGSGDGRDLFLDSNGKSTTTFDIYTRDVMDSAYGAAGPNIYASFIGQMNGLKGSGTINDWEALPYDWRLSFDDILNTGKKVGDKIYYDKATSTPFILQEIEHLAQTSKTGKVTIVAHSNGGLLTKAIMERLESEGLGGIVDKIIFVAVPQIGTPQAIAGMLHGEDQGIPTDWFSPFFPKSTARTLGENAPGAYALLPSFNYFTYVDTPPITFSNPLATGWRDYYGDLVHSEERLHTFLTDVVGRSKPLESDVSRPNILSESLLTSAESAHHNLDVWQPPAGVRVIQIAGWGVPDTLSSIDYANGTFDPSIPVMMSPKFVSDGDGTVVTPSALWMNGSSTERYWVDLAEYNKNHPISTFFKKITHPYILEIPELRDFIVNIITNKSVPLPAYLSTSEPIVDPSIKRLQFALHSPLTLDLFDSSGRHTGISTTTGKIEERIPGTYYKEFGEVKYIFSDETRVNHISMSGYGSGKFTFNVNELQGDTVVASTTFANIPTTPQTKVSFNVLDSLTNASKLAVDTDGDSTVDFSLTPKLGATVTDQTPPTTSITFTGTEGKNSWYTSDVGFSIVATDTESGIARTTYSLDNGATWQTFASTTNPLITKEGTTTILYHSTDYFGNKEVTATSIIRIDKSAPEANIYFDPMSQKLKIIGADNLTNNLVVTDFATLSLIVDEAGHTLKIVYSEPKKKQKEKGIDTRITKLIYDGVATSSLALLKYEWSTKKDGNYSALDQYIEVSGDEVEARFIPKKNQTILMTRSNELDERGEDESDSRSIQQILPGMVIIRIETEKGIIKRNIN